MNTSTTDALLLTAVMAAVIFFCRVCAFLFFRQDNASPSVKAFLGFVEKIVPPLAMTVLTFNALSVPLLDSFKQGVPMQGLPVLIAAAFTVLVHLWQRNPLLSIFGGTAVYMVLERVFF